MRKLIRTARGAAIATVLVGAVAGPAAADKPGPVELTCGGVVYQITVGSTLWGVGSVVDSSTHFIPYTFDITITDEQGNVVYSASYAKNGAAHQNQDGQLTCTFSNTVVDAGQVFTISGSAQVVRRP